ncbi:MAG: SpoIIE family protein phosphatase [Candidatus Riflebacteria bacterium]|nr:SpoIIE family protein phosphatase [Candidatus Riflebacteria bacterium]
MKPEEGRLPTGPGSPPPPDRRPSWRAWAAWAVVTCLVGGLPAWLIGLAGETLAGWRRAGEEEIRQKHLVRRLEAVQPFAEPGRLWVKLLSELGRRAERQADPGAWLARAFPRFTRRWGVPLAALAWDEHGRLVWNGVPWPLSAADLAVVGKELRTRSRPSSRGALDIPSPWLEAMRRVLGGQFLPPALDEAHGATGRLVLTSLHSAWPYIWWTGQPRLTLLVFARPAAMERSHGLARIMAFCNRRPRGGEFLGLIDRGTARLPARRGAASVCESLAAVFGEAERNLEPAGGSGDLQVAFRPVTDDLTLVAGHIRPQGGWGRPWSRHLPWLAGGLLVVGVGWLAHRRLVAGLPPPLSAGGRIALLLFLANALPLLVLLFLGVDHHRQKEAGLEREATRRMGDFLETFDKRFRTWTIRFRARIEGFLRLMETSLRRGPLDQDLGRRLASATVPHGMWDFYLIASGSPVMATRFGLVHGESARGRQRPREGLTGETADQEERRFVSHVGRRILWQVNGEDPGMAGEGDIDRIGLMVETFTQRPLVEIIHTFFADLDRIVLRGFGNSRAFSFLSFLRLHGPTRGTPIPNGPAPRDLADYFLIITWHPAHFQRWYLEQALARVQRNSQGFRLLVSFRDDAPPLSLGAATGPAAAGVPGKNPDLSLPPPLQRVAARMVRAGDREPVRLVLAGRRHLAAGLSGRQLDRSFLMTLLPRETIDDILADWERRVRWFALLSLAVTLVVGGGLVRKVGRPVRHLAAAAAAIGLRRFDHRLPPLGNDEFGELGRVFNRALVGLGELQVARVVQGGLFPAGRLVGEGFAISGESRAMGELGGDFFDYFEVGNGRCAVLIGDVAGHGLPAALTMAMARAGVLHGTAEGLSPADLLARLNALLRALAPRGRPRFMTFQYILLDRPARRATVANAGHCSPLVVRRGGQRADPVELPSYPLASRSRLAAPTATVLLDPGDVMVLYTDGLIEARDARGNELGYDGFAALARQSWHPRPGAMESAIREGFARHLGNQAAQDDLTLVLVACLDNGSAEP